MTVHDIMVKTGYMLLTDDGPLLDVITKLNSILKPHGVSLEVVAHDDDEHEELGELYVRVIASTEAVK